MTTPAERLRAVARSMPVMDQAAAQRAADAQQALALGAVGAAAAKGPLTGAQVASAGAQTAAAVAAPAAAAAGQSVETLGRIAQAGIQQQAQATQTAQARQGLEQEVGQANAARAQAAQLGEADRSQKLRFNQSELDAQARMQATGLEVDRNLSFMTEAQRADLARLGRDVRAELFDKRIQFERDEAGRKFTNDRQLWDFNVATAKSEEQLKSRQQNLIQASERKALLVDAAYGKLLQKAEFDWRKADQAKDHASKQRIGEYITKLKKQQADAQSKGAKRGMVMSATASGAVAGTAVMPGYGTAIGAGIGFVAGMAAAGGPSEVI